MPPKRKPKPKPKPDQPERDSRLEDLIRKMSEAFRNGEDPFNSVWLSENRVTFDECVMLSLIIADALQDCLI